jgi:hypothetical protein
MNKQNIYILPQQKRTTSWIVLSCYLSSVRLGSFLLAGAIYPESKMIPLLTSLSYIHLCSV